MIVALKNSTKRKKHRGNFPEVEQKDKKRKLEKSEQEVQHPNHSDFQKERSGEKNKRKEPINKQIKKITQN